MDWGAFYPPAAGIRVKITWRMPVCRIGVWVRQGFTRMLNVGLDAECVCLAAAEKRLQKLQWRVNERTSPVMDTERGRQTATAAAADATASATTNELR